VVGVFAGIYLCVRLDKDHAIEAAGTTMFLGIVAFIWLLTGPPPWV